MLTALLAGCQENKSNSEEESGLGAVSVDKVTVYTTAKDTDKRLTITDQLTFEPGVRLRALSQPLKPAQNTQH